MNQISDIYDYEVPNLVNKLIRFIGRAEIEKCLVRYKRSLRLSGPVFREYYLKTRHPWWEALIEYFALEKSGKSIKRNLNERIKILAGDAKTISVLQRLMPEKIKTKYKKDLIDDNHAYDFLFEIQIAWHFFLKGCEIIWHEDDSKSHSEFLVRDSNLEFNVECKRISVDISRKIRRRDFYRFAEKLLPEVEVSGFSGSIDITLKDRLHSNDKYLRDLSTQVIDKIRLGCLHGTHQIQFGSVSIDLQKANGTIIDLDQHFRKLLERKSHQSHGAIFAKSRNTQPADPVEMTIISEKTDNVLEAIKDRLSKAAKKQLDIFKPGLICCYLEGINDLTELAQNSGLQIMTNHLFSKEGLNHIAAVSYSSENIIDRFANIETYFNQGLIFRNPYCKFAKAKDYKYLSNINRI
ncbi:MAG: hypothetical protein U9N18_00465 [Campylobacterota bacterium]|nr:hypothetical protein [Campylobacterota bacterium]